MKALCQIAEIAFQNAAGNKKLCRKKSCKDKKQAEHPGIKKGGAGYGLFRFQEQNNTQNKNQNDCNGNQDNLENR